MPNIHHLLSPLLTQCLPNTQCYNQKRAAFCCGCTKNRLEERKKEEEEKNFKKRYLKQCPESKGSLKGGFNVNASWSKEEIAQIMPESSPFNIKTYQQENTVA